MSEDIVAQKRNGLVARRLGDMIKFSDLPEHIKKLAPKRENFTTEEEYQEAKAYFIHRLKGKIRPPIKKDK